MESDLNSVTFGLPLEGWSCHYSHNARWDRNITRAGSANDLLPSNDMKQFTGCVKGLKGNSAKKWSFHLLKLCMWHVRAKTSLIHCFPACGLKWMCSWYAFDLWWILFVGWAVSLICFILNKWHLRFSWKRTNPVQNDKCCFRKV